MYVFCKSVPLAPTILSARVPKGRSHKIYECQPVQQPPSLDDPWFFQVPEQPFAPPSSKVSNPRRLLSVSTYGDFLEIAIIRFKTFSSTV